MDISTRKQRSVQVVRLKGSLRLGRAVEELKSTARDLIDEGDVYMVLNLTEVPMIDSSGIGELVRLQTSLRGQGGEVKLVNPSKFVLQTLTLMCIGDLFDTYSDESAAVDAFGDA